VDSAKYNCEALQILIPMLDGPIETLDAEVLAAICLLRLCEEMQGMPPTPVPRMTCRGFLLREEVCTVIPMLTAY
jgi:hypothetical protein